MHVILHDAIDKGKDVNEIVEELKLNFGESVYDTIRSLTEPKTNEENREKLLVNYFDNISKGPKMPRFIKIADRLDNARFMKNNRKKEKALRYKEENAEVHTASRKKNRRYYGIEIIYSIYEIK